MDCTNIHEATKMATELYREAIHVPFMSKFVVFSKRHQVEEARVRVFCMTDDKEDKTLETQEQFIEVAKSRDVEVLEGKTQYLEFGGNLVPVTKSGEQLAFNFYAFRENRLPFTVRVKDINAESVGRVAFMRQPKVGRGDPPQNPICNLNLSLPENVQPELAPSEPDLLSLERKYAFLSISKADTIHKADLRLSDIANMLSDDWVPLAQELEVSESDIDLIKSQYPDNAPQQAIVMLRLWLQTAGNKVNENATGNTLEKALRSIDRNDIVDHCIFNVELVTDDLERAVAKSQLDQDLEEAQKIIPTRNVTIIRDESMDVSYDEKDMMKEAESADEDEFKKDTSDGRKDTMSPTYETEEKKYAGEEKKISEKVIHEESTSKLIEEKKEETINKRESLSKDGKYSVEEDILKKADKRSEEENLYRDEKFTKELSNKDGEISEKLTHKIDDLHQQSKEQLGEKLHEQSLIEGVPDKGVTKTDILTYEKSEEKSFQESRRSQERVEETTKPSLDKDKLQEVTEVMTAEVKKSPVEVKSTQPQIPKEELLQKLGEELGRLDEKLEAKFKEQKAQESDRSSQPSGDIQTEEVIIPKSKSDPPDVRPIQEISLQSHPDQEHDSILQTENKDVGVVFTVPSEIVGGETTVESGHKVLSSESKAKEPIKYTDTGSPDTKHENTIGTGSSKVTQEKAEELKSYIEENIPPYSERKEYWEKASSVDSRSSLDELSHSDSSHKTEHPVSLIHKKEIIVETADLTCDISTKDVQTKRKHFEEEIKRQSSEDSISWKKSPRDDSAPSSGDFHDIDDSKSIKPIPEYESTLQSKTESADSAIGTFETKRSSFKKSCETTLSTSISESKNETLVEERLLINKSKEVTEEPKLLSEKNFVDSNASPAKTVDVTDKLPKMPSVNLDSVREVPVSPKVEIISEKKLPHVSDIDSKEISENVIEKAGESLAVSFPTDLNMLLKTNIHTLENSKCEVLKSAESDKFVKTIESKKIEHSALSDDSKDERHEKLKEAKTEKHDESNVLTEKVEQTISHEKQEVAETKKHKETGLLIEECISKRIEYSISSESQKDDTIAKEGLIIKNVNKDKTGELPNKDTKVEKQKEDAKIEKSEEYNKVEKPVEVTKSAKLEESSILIEKVHPKINELLSTEKKFEGKPYKEDSIATNEKPKKDDTSEIIKDRTKSEELAKLQESSLKKDHSSLESHEGKIITDTTLRTESLIVSDKIYSSKKDEFSEIIPPLSEMSDISGSSEICEPESKHFNKQLMETTLSNVPLVQKQDDSLVNDSLKSSVHKVSSAEANVVSETTIEESRRILGDTEEFLITETTTTMDGRQEERVIRETKMQETVMSDGSKVKTTSVTTFTTQLDRQDSSTSVTSTEDQDSLDKQIEKKIKDDLIAEELHHKGEELSPEKKALSPKTSITILHDTPSDQEPPESLDVSGSTASKTPLTKGEAMSLAIDIVEEVKSEAFKRSPMSTPGDEIEDEHSSLPKVPVDSSFSSNTSTKIEQYIQDQLTDGKIDNSQIKLLESVAAKKSAIMHKKITLPDDISLEITDEDLRCSAADLSPVEHHTERLRLMTEEDEQLIAGKEPSEADESESSLIIHETVDDRFTAGYDQANEMFGKTLDTIKQTNLRGDRTIDTISEEPDAPKDLQEKDPEIPLKSRSRTPSREELEETARHIVEEVTLKATNSDLLIQKKLDESTSSQSDQYFTASGKDESSKSDHQYFTASQGKDESSKSDHASDSQSKDLSKSEKTSEPQMESSMTESVEECSAAESTRAYETRFITEVSHPPIKEICESEILKKNGSKISEEVILRKKSHIQDFNRRSGTDIDAYSSSGESHYFTPAEAPSDKSSSRPCSSDVDGLLSGTGGGGSEYDTALTSQDSSQPEFSTAPSSISSRDSMRSVDSESSGHLGSMELSSEASETLVPSSVDIEKDLDLLEKEDLPIESDHSIFPKDKRTDRYLSDTSSDEDPQCVLKSDSQPMSSKMKRSMEMTFYPEPKPLTKEETIEKSQGTMEESTISDISNVTVIEKTTQDDPSKFETTPKVPPPSPAKPMTEYSIGVATATSSESITQNMYTSSSIVSTSKTVITEVVSSSSINVEKESMTSCEISHKEQSSTKDFFLNEGPLEVKDGLHEEDIPRQPDMLSGNHSSILGGRSGGPSIALHRFEPEAEQELKADVNVEDFTESELLYTDNEYPEAEMEEHLGVVEPIERPKTPEPGDKPKEEKMYVDSPGFNKEKFSAIFSTTYEDPDSPTPFRKGSDHVPNIIFTEHMAPIQEQYRYPDLECEENFPECKQESGTISSVTSPKSSTTDSETGKEYCLDYGGIDKPESFELVDVEEITDPIEYERTIYFHEKRLKDMVISEEGEDNEEDAEPVPYTLKAVKIDTNSPQSSSHSTDGDLLEEEDIEYGGIEEQKEWLERQFDPESQQHALLEHVYAGPLEDIEEEREEFERRDMSHVTKNSSLSSTPDYDILAGRKFFARSSDQDDISVSSLQEFEKLEGELAKDGTRRSSLASSQESLNGKRPSSEAKSTHGDDISVGSFSSLNEFEKLEADCVAVDQLEKKVREEEAMLSEIEEGHESQVSESESCETISEAGKDSEDEGESYDQRLFEIEEIIRQAQHNVEQFEQEGVTLQDIAESGGAFEERTPSVELEDSLNEETPQVARKSDIDVSSNVANKKSSDDSFNTSAHGDIMITSADSLEFPMKKSMTESIDSLEDPRRQHRSDIMQTSVDSLGKDDSSGREADISSGSERIPHLGGVMEWSTDSIEPTSSQATHATYQYETDSMMSGSFTSGCSTTLMPGEESVDTSLYVDPEIPTDPLTHETFQSTRTEAEVIETVTESSEPGYTKIIERTVKYPPEVKQVIIKGPESQIKLDQFVKEFSSGEHESETEHIDSSGNIHVKKVVQKKFILDPKYATDKGIIQEEPEIEESVSTDKHGNITRVIKRTVVSTHEIEIDLATGEPIIYDISDTTEQNVELRPIPDPSNLPHPTSPDPITSKETPEK